MKLDKLKAAETAFMERYPGGFQNPEMLETGRKHRLATLSQRAREAYQPENFNEIEIMSEAIIKTVTASSMVSVFEKPKFRDFVRELPAIHRARLCSHIYQLLHGDKERGFNELRELLVKGKVAKWTIMTVFPYYWNPNEEAFIKPTTAKTIIAYYELEHLTYRPLPYWEFYLGFRDELKSMMAQVHPLLGPDLAAFSAFLMIGAGAW